MSHIKQFKLEHTYYFLFLLMSVLLFSLPGCQSSSRKKEVQADFDALSKEYIVSTFKDDTISLHFKLDNPEEQGIDEHTDPKLAELSYDAQYTQYKEQEKMLSKLLTFNYDALSDEQKLTYDILKYKLELASQSKNFIFYASSLGTNGIFSQIPVALSEYRLEDEEDIKTYLALVKQIPTLLQQCITFEQQRADQGFLSAEFTIHNTTDQIDQFLAQDTEHNLLITTFEERLDKLTNLGKDKKDTYIANHQSLITEKIIPSYTQAKEDLETLPVLSDDSVISLADSQEGIACYNHLLLATGIDLSAEECETALSKEIFSVVKEIQTITQDNADIYSSYLSAKPKSGEPKELLDALESLVSTDFPSIPKVSYQLKEVPDSISSISAVAFYLVPPIDASTENEIYVNEMRIHTEDLFSTLAHEGYPGHMYQTNYYKNTHPPIIRGLLTSDAYVEGWGTYAQLYSYDYLTFGELSEKEQKQLATLYKDSNLLSIYLSSLSDLYVNYEGYDRQGLRDFLADYGVSETSADYMYEYVIEEPCSYLSYGIGYYELMMLKQEQEEVQGEDFSLIDFHKQILDLGPCPFSVLRKYIAN